MNCLDFRRLATGDPGNRGAEFLEHRLGCRGCAGQARELASLDSRLRAALRVDVPENLEARVMFNAASRSSGMLRRRWLALAAGVLVAAGASLTMLFGVGSADLPVAVVEHMLHEPAMLEPGRSVMNDAEVRQVVARSRARLISDIGTVTSAGMCLFRGHWVAHLVMQGVRGPVTVMLLPDEKVDGPVQIVEEGFSGTILPAGTGAIAIVGVAGEEMPAIEEQVLRGVEWSL